MTLNESGCVGTMSLLILVMVALLWLTLLGATWIGITVNIDGHEHLVRLG